ncbi:MAG: hypothetical protein RLZZ242_334 [Bacteroidota bacterium]
MNRLRLKWAMLGGLERLIVFQVVLFVIFGLFNLFGLSLFSYFDLSSSLTDLVFKPWSILTYAFLHQDLWHLVFNMLWLYYAGQFFLNFFDFERLFSLFLLGVLFAGLTYLTAYNVIPSFTALNAAMVGSSAGVMAVLIFMATYSPNQPIQLLFFRLKLWHLGVFFVLIDLLQLSSGVNFGGRLAHLAGAGIGYFSASQLLKGNDVTEGFQRLVSRLVRAFSHSSSHRRRSPFSFTVHKGASRNARKKAPPTDQERIDAILDKISASGYDSLTADEKAFLFKKGR